jgi:hypothetical protein
MHSLHQLSDELHRERLAYAAQQRPARRLVAYRNAARRAERRLRTAARQAMRLRVELER